MRVKIKVIKESIKRIEKRLAKLKIIFDARPLSEIINLQKQAIENAKKMAPCEALKYLDKAIKREKVLYKISKQQCSKKFIDEQIDLEFELHDLKDELFWVTKSYGKSG